MSLSDVGSTVMELLPWPSVSADDAVSLIDTKFPVDHTEPREVLDAYVAARQWVLGTLREGHEFVLLLPLPVQGRSRTV